MSSGGYLTFVTQLGAGTRTSDASRTCVTRRRSVVVYDTGERPLALSSERMKSIPWEKSIVSDEVPMLFMPCLELQKHVINETQKSLKDLPFDADLSYRDGINKPAKIESWNLESEHFRKIRMTYIDAGYPAQVFNSVFYPRYNYDLPVLGIDLLSFGKKRILCVLDFQPLKQDPDYLEKYTGILAPIRAKYPSLAGKMSAKFYDENTFFSKELAFGRYDSPELVPKEVYPAFEEYLRTYIDMVMTADPSDDPKILEENKELQREYDQYSAERDPAIGLFTTYFGEDWATRFTHEFLFELSEHGEEEF